MANVRQRRSGTSSNPALRLVGAASSAARAEPTDPSLTRGLVAGEAWAATLVWHRYGPMVYGLFDRALGPAGESEDLTQDVFLSLFASISRLRDPSALRSFIYSSALRRLRWHLRKKRIRRVLMLSPSGELPEGESAGVDSEGRELLARFYRLLDQLSVNDRTAYSLRYIEGLSLGEVVSATGASLATVKRRISRACADIAVRVKEDPDLLPYLVPLGAADAS